jgi:hypothetical protein
MSRPGRRPETVIKVTENGPPEEVGQRWFAKLTDPLALFTAALVAATLLLALISLLQWRTLEKTDNTLWANQRPWVQVHLAFDKPLKLSELEGARSVTVPVSLSLQNHGNVPATDIVIKGLATNGSRWDRTRNHDKLNTANFRKSASGCAPGLASCFPNKPSPNTGISPAGSTRQNSPRLSRS